VTLRCPTKGASIAYKVASQNSSTLEEDEGEREINEWKTYTDPLPITSGKTILAVAVRYGYQQSEVQFYTAQ